MLAADYVKQELEEMLNGDSISHDMAKGILEIAEVYDRQHHSGASGTWCVNALNRLLRHIPITPLTGEEDEWDYTFGHAQNKRCPRIFKDEDGRAYDSEGKIFSCDGGKTWFTNADSHVYIDFPYMVPVYPEEVLL